MRRKAQYRCAISNRVCPFNDDFWEIGGADSAAADGCPIGKYEANHHTESVYLGDMEYCGERTVYDDWCKHLRERKDNADVAPVVHGHWKKCKPDALIWWECSVCGVPHYLDEPRGVFYCPNCGAKMDESEDRGNE